jgi:fructose-bisphosphate aldolase class II
MPIVSPAQFTIMLERAQKEGFGYPSINCSNMESIRAAINGFENAQSDGIVQISISSAKKISSIDAVDGALALAEYTARYARGKKINVAITTDHCETKDLSFLDGLIADCTARIQRGEASLFQGMMYDGSHDPLEDNIRVSVAYLKKLTPLGITLETEIGQTGGVEDGLAGNASYSSPEQIRQMRDALRVVGGAYTIAASFGNVHGLAKAGEVKLKPEILADLLVEAKQDTHFKGFVFHGGSGSSKSEVKQAVANGVVKMNVDTECQLEYSRPVYEHVLKTQQDVLNTDLPNKKHFDPRAWGAKAVDGMAVRVVQACDDMCSHGKAMMIAKAA